MKSIWVGIKRGTLLATGLRAYATDPDLRQEWMMVEKVNKMRLAEYIEAMSGVKVSLDAMFDVQTKRIHEYKKHLLNILGIIHRYDSIEMDDRRWQDLEIDCLVKVFEKVGMEWVLLDVPFVCKSWYKATLNPSCWQCLIFPDNERTEVWPWDDFECPDFQNLMDRIASEFQIDGDRFSVTTFLKFVINRSTGTAVLLKLPKCCTVETFEFAANVCPGLVTSGLPLRLLESEHTNPELIGN